MITWPPGHNGLQADTGGQSVDGESSTRRWTPECYTSVTIGT